MTTITVYTSEDGTIAGYQASGHAHNRRVQGNDLVCCAVSVLTQTGVNALCSVAGIEPAVEVKDGFLSCFLPEGMEDQQKETAQIVLRTMMTGLTDIQKIYPNLIRIQYKEWRQADAYDESSALRS